MGATIQNKGKRERSGAVWVYNWYIKEKSLSIFADRSVIGNQSSDAYNKLEKLKYSS